MANLFKNFNLTRNALDIFLVVDFLFLKDFYSNLNQIPEISDRRIMCGFIYLFTRQNMRSLLHMPECTFSKCLA